MTPTDRFDPIGATPHEIRTAMVANGYGPTPLRGGKDGKKPMLEDWTNIVATQEIVDQWGNEGPNTGMLTATTPVLDIDILDEQAAQMVEETARLYLEGSGQILIRIGNAPKRAILMRTDQPFQKIRRKLTAPNGDHHQIEVLCRGQQLAVAGIHPDTGKPYVWKNGHSPVNTAREKLPPADDIATIVNLCVEELKSKLGWKEVFETAAPNIQSRAHHADGGIVDALRTPTLNQRLEAMAPGVDVNDTMWRAVGSLICRGVHMNDVVAELTQAAMDVAPSPDWTPEKQRWEIERMCLRTILKDEALFPQLSDKYREQMERLRADGYQTFIVSGNHYGPYIRSSGKSDEPAPEIPTVESPARETAGAKQGAPFILRPRGIINPDGIPPRTRPKPL